MLFGVVIKESKSGTEAIDLETEEDKDNNAEEKPWQKFERRQNQQEMRRSWTFLFDKGMVMMILCRVPGYRVILREERLYFLSKVY